MRHGSCRTWTNSASLIASTSPLLKSAKGSSHGYDVCDPESLNPELGADEDYDAWSLALRDRDMGLLLDFVPNHMGLDADGQPLVARCPGTRPKLAVRRLFRY